MSLPFLPGYTFSNPRKTEHKKQQVFNYKNGYSTVVMPVDTAELDRELATATSNLAMQSQRITDADLTYGRRDLEQTTFVPAFVALDGQMLQYDAYFQERVQESRDETYRVRPVKITYFLEDDSIMVTEPRIKNSGLPQGTLIKRHRIPNGTTGFYGVEDLIVGQDVTFYARTYTIVDATPSTREYLASIGLDCPEAQPIPSDPYTSRREALFEPKPRSTAPNAERAQLKKFLETGGKVLRFYCLWDDRDALFGEARPFVLHFFLADDTIEILEVSKANSGRDPFPVFLRRQRLPKRFTGVKDVGQRVNEYYEASDFIVGETLSVLGRTFLIYDADEFTKQYMREHFGIENFAVINTEEAPRELPRPEIPPYNGYGTEEDSLGSVNALVPKAPKRDFKKYILNDGKVLRFAAKMITTRAEDVDRRFIISYFLSDDSILVYEPPQRNSGIGGGKFLERQKIKKVGSDSYYSDRDLRVGVVVEFLRHQFMLIDADEFAFKYMEEHPTEFPESDIDAIHSGLAPLAKKLQAACARYDDGNGTVTLAKFRDAIAEAGAQLTDQQLITLMRRYDQKHEGRVHFEDLVRVLSGDLRATRKIASAPRVVDTLNRLRTTLARRGADGIAGLGRSFRIIDRDRTHSLDAEEFKTSLRQYNVSLDDGEIADLFAYFDKDGSGAVDYDEFLRGLRGEMSEQRRAIVQECFRKLDATGDGKITIADIKQLYNARQHPLVKTGQMTEEQVFKEFLNNFDSPVTDGVITAEEFEEYYANISASVDNENHFALILQNAWQLSNGPRSRGVRMAPASLASRNLASHRK